MDSIHSQLQNNSENVSKISIIIDYQIKSFSELFYCCGCIESIEFKKFCRNNVTGVQTCALPISYQLHY